MEDEQQARTERQVGNRREWSALLAGVKDPPISDRSVAAADIQSILEACQEVLEAAEAALSSGNGSDLLATLAVRLYHLEWHWKSLQRLTGTDWMWSDEVESEPQD